MIIKGKKVADRRQSSQTVPWDDRAGLRLSARNTSLSPHCDGDEPCGAPLLGFGFVSPPLAGGAGGFGWGVMLEPPDGLDDDGAAGSVVLEPWLDEFVVGCFCPHPARPSARMAASVSEYFMMNLLNWPD